jgi:hypothetical protein
MPRKNEVMHALAGTHGFTAVAYEQDCHKGYDSSYHTQHEYGWENAKPTHLVIDFTAWGDYSGDSCNRSNQRSLLRDFPRSVTMITGGFGYSALVVSLRSVNEGLFDALSGLADYPLYDEEDHSALEMECADEAWEQFAKSDLRRDLENRAAGRDTRRAWERERKPMIPSPFTGVPEFLTEYLNDQDDANGLDRLREWFYESLQDMSGYPYLETADSIVFPDWDDMVLFVEDKIIADLLEDYRDTEIPGQQALTV